MTESEKLRGRIMSLLTPAPWAKNLRLVRESLDRLAAQTDLSRIRKVYLTGGGTSLYAAEVGKYYMEKLAGLCAQAVPCYSLSRYTPQALSGDSACLVAISQTGQATSVADCVRAAQRTGALDIAVSGYTDAPVPTAARHVILTDAATEGPSVKSTSYTQALVAAFLLAVAIGRANGHLTQEQEAYWNGQLDTAIQKSFLLRDAAVQMEHLAGLYRGAPIHHCLAAGPNIGTAEESALKIIEMAWVPAEGREMEDFLHGRYREVDASTPLLLIAPKGPSKKKLMDTLGSSRRIPAPTIVLTDDGDPAIAKLAAHVVRMPGGLDEHLTPLLYITPLWVYAHRLGELRGSDPAGNRHGFVPTRYEYSEHYDSAGNPIAPTEG